MLTDQILSLTATELRRELVSFDTERLRRLARTCRRLLDDERLFSASLAELRARRVTWSVKALRDGLERVLACSGDTLAGRVSAPAQ